MSRALLVANPAAGGSAGADLAGEALRLARAAGWEAELAWTETPGHAFLLAEEAAANGAGAVIAVGGDGTVREVAAGLAGTGRESAGRPARGPRSGSEDGAGDHARADAAPVGAALGIVPAGRGNSTYRELHGTAPWAETLAAALRSGRTRAVDMIRVDPTGELALLGFSVGWFAQVVEMAQRPGAGDYAGVAQAAAAAPVRFTAHVSLDGTTLADGALGLVAAGGARVRGRVFPIFPESRMDDGLLEVMTVAAVAPARFAELLGAVLQGRHGEQPEVAVARGRELVIRSGLPLPAE
ncbi:MAG TPA: diacylglycerol kinase family protein, partial [Candidatus Dormibacteraeota bacterium]|nr:diacylglycerol kinase family protein [Candidatus Dormibacteraeota bacterium]